jgi:hypothetical protein
MASKNYAGELLNFFRITPGAKIGSAEAWPKPYADPTGRPGRPNSLNDKRFGQLLKAIAEENSNNETVKTNEGIAGKLIVRPEYSYFSLRQLRRRVRQRTRTTVRTEKRSMDSARERRWPFPQWRLGSGPDSLPI